MNYLLSTLVFGLFSVATAAQAQTSELAQADKAPGSVEKAKTSEKETTVKDAPSDDLSGTPKMVAPKSAKDLDDFFSEGAKQAKDGPSCHKPPAPVA